MSEVPAPIQNKRAALDLALANIKKEMSPVTKDGANPHFRSTFATLNAHLKAVEPLLEKHGCFLTQEMVGDARNGKNLQRTTITHAESGQNIESFIYLPELTDMQKMGSAITYARRYTLGCVLAMQAEDDDANAASGKKKVSAAVNKGDF